MTADYVTITSFQRVNNVAIAAPKTISWPTLVERLSQHERNADKRDVPGWSPTLFRPTCDCGADNCPGLRGHRLTENALEVYALVLDLDKRPDGQPLDEISAEAALSRLVELNLRHVVHTTHSHAPPALVALRVVIALSRPVPAREWEGFWIRAVEHLGLHVESSCSNPDRFWFAPAARLDARPWSKAADGNPLDVDSLISHAPPPPVRPAPRPYTPRGGAFDPADAIPRWCPGAPEYERRGRRCWDVECPQAHLHTPGSGGKHDTVASIGPDGKPGFKCQHGHCVALKWQDFRKHHEPGWIPFEERATATATATASVPADELSRARARKAKQADPPRSVPQLELRHAGIGPEGGYRCTDLGNARRFADMHSSRMRYVHAWGQWLMWDGRRWKRDDRGAEAQAGKAVVAAIYNDAARCMASAAAAINAGDSAGPSAVEGLSKWATDSAKRARIEAMIALARSESEIAATQGEFNRNPWLFNVANGTIDLHEGELQPHRQSDMITVLADVEYDPNAKAPEWERFLDEVLPDEEIRGWIQRYLGYSLTGLVSEQQFAFWVGKGGNGKNVCIDAVIATLGEYAIVGAPDLLLEKHNEAHPTELADIEGRRLVVCSEIEQGRAWAEGRIKEITGNRTIKARRMGEDFFEFCATSKLVVLANTKPKVKSADNGLWRRMNLVPWLVQIPAERRDKDLLDRLIGNERPGILAWLVRGCLAWQDRGLGSARSITIATDEYRRSEDVLGLWIAERCRSGVGCWQSTTDLYDGYRSWCRDEGIEKPWTLKAWMARLTEREGVSRKSNGIARGIDGIRLLGPGETPNEW